MRIERFTKTFVAAATDGTYTDGSGLYLHVRGKSKSWSFRYSGRRISPPGGSARHIGVEQAQAFVRECRDQLARDEDPFTRRVAPPVQTAEFTFRNRVAEFYEHKCKSAWGSKQAQALGRTMIRNYLDPAACVDLPFQTITWEHIFEILNPFWKTKPVITKRTANFVYGMFKRAKKKGWYVGENPGDTTKDSELGEALGPQPPGGHHRDLKVKYIPQLMAYLRTPRYPRSHQHSDEYCTVSEAMEATGVGREAINRAIRMGRLPGSYKERGYDWQQAPYLIPVAGLKELTPLLQPIRSHAKITLHAHILQYLILTLVRADMACKLRWDMVDPDGQGTIDYGIQHKSGQKNSEAAPYIVIITPAVAELLDTMRALQNRDRLNSDYVFVHGRVSYEVNTRLNRPTIPQQVNSYMQAAVEYLGIPQRGGPPTDHGFRTAFATWALQLHSCYRENAVSVTLGHAIDVPNPMYYRNVDFLAERRKMMLDWERDCLALCGQPQQEKVVKLTRKTPT